ncbi:MAG: hypothetical protein IKL52_05910 [Candidatus Gastranaerophilales bacterium]|nr:hypothetical protein [Candidatus Gastranaerophilales bacterium]
MTTTPVYSNSYNGTPNVGGGNGGSNGSSYRIRDFSFLGTDLEIMHSRLSGNNEKEALAMRSEMADNIMEMYANNGSSITRDEALAMVDTQYKYMSGGASVVDTIKETTKDADSFWNYVPIVNLFIDDTSEEDLYKMMDEEQVDTETAEGKTGKVAGNVASGAAVGAAIGTALGGWAFGLGTAIGAGVGALVGLFSGLFD